MIEWKSPNAPIKAWVDNVPVESEAIDQLRNVASLPFIYKHVAAMPDVHVGMGATIGSVIATKDAVIPSAVGVDIGCGMIAQRTHLKIEDLSLKELRKNIENAVPHGRSNNGGKGDKGSWSNIPKLVQKIWKHALEDDFERIVKENRGLLHHKVNTVNHLGTLGGGNHFIEICVDEEDHVWIMLHSGSRGIGNRIGQYFINLAKEVCKTSPKLKQKIEQEIQKFFESEEFKSLSKSKRRAKAVSMKMNWSSILKDASRELPDPNLAYFTKDDPEFKRYLNATRWALKFAMYNRSIMMELVGSVLCDDFKSESFSELINCHHNYVEYDLENDIYITRKGAISARKGQLGIIPGSMGAKSYIVSGLGNPDSFWSASHGAGRIMSRTEAKQTFTIQDHIKTTQGVECRKDEDILDETPMAYKNIDKVMEAQKSLVEIKHTLKQVICVKG